MGIEVILSSKSGVPILGFDDQAQRVVPFPNVYLGGAIAFPPNPTISSDPNVLDDYEEGLWTPSLFGSGGQSGQVYAGQFGAYTKIGQMVQVAGRLDLTTLGTLTGNIGIQGFPFTFKNYGPFGYPPLAVSCWLNLAVSKNAMSLIVNPNTTQALVFGVAAAGLSHINIVQADLGNTSILIFGGCYMTSQ